MHQRQRREGERERDYLKTFVLDELFNTVNNIQLALIIKVSKISSMNPTLFIYCKLGGLWIIIIT